MSHRERSNDTSTLTALAEHIDPLLTRGKRVPVHLEPAVAVAVPLVRQRVHLVAAEQRQVARAQHRAARLGRELRVRLHVPLAHGELAERAVRRPVLGAVEVRGRQREQRLVDDERAVRAHVRARQHDARERAVDAAHAVAAALGARGDVAQQLCADVHVRGRRRDHERLDARLHGAHGRVREVQAQQRGEDRGGGGRCDAHGRAVAEAEPGDGGRAGGGVRAREAADERVRGRVVVRGGRRWRAQGGAERARGAREQGAVQAQRLGAVGEHDVHVGVAVVAAGVEGRCEVVERRRDRHLLWRGGGRRS